MSKLERERSFNLSSFFSWRICCNDADVGGELVVEKSAVASQPSCPADSFGLGDAGEPADLTTGCAVPCCGGTVSRDAVKEEFKVEDVWEKPVEPMVPAELKKANADANAENVEEEVQYNHTWEKMKSFIAAVFVFGPCIGGVVFLRLSASAHEHEPASCANVDTDRLRSCDLCATGTSVLPLGGDWEKGWPAELRAILYFLGMIWSFMGVGMVCDEFVGAIEAITNRERPVWMKGADGARYRVHVTSWNPTLANLSLMALGSSAPEILLSSVEILTNGFEAGSLGPQTVVGSAAFNLYVITAVCVSAIPIGEIRKIDKLKVFCFTAATSVSAYAWIIVILVLVSPDRVELWEGIVTLAFFVAFLVIAFFLDKASQEKDRLSIEEEAAIKKFRSQIEKEYGKPLSSSSVRTMLENQIGEASGKQSAFGFQQAEISVLECVGTMKVAVLAPALATPVLLSYQTRDGAALAGKRYAQASGTLRFESYESRKDIELQIIDNEVWDPLEEFYVDIVDVKSEGMAKMPRLGISSCTIWVVNDDEPGTLDFRASEVSVECGTSELVVTVIRTNGSLGRITCQYETIGVSAVAGTHFEETSGELELADGQTSVDITVPILRMPKVPVRFRITLQDPSEGVAFNSQTDGGSQTAICTVTLQGTNLGSCPTSCSSTCDEGEFMLGLSQWRDKFSEVWLVGGSMEDQASAGVKEWVIHCLELVWKFFSLPIPPATLLGGWPAFITALVMIAVETILINDLASLLGCSMGMADDVTALTIVALGTSVPDTLASRTAAKQEDNADNSIGNVTGSNSVNVFLGLGISWTMGAAYWDSVGTNYAWRTSVDPRKNFRTFEDLYIARYPDGGFMVPAGPLVFSVGVFTVGALVTVLMLFFRRKTYGGELGGPWFAQMRDSTLLFVLWLAFIAANVIYNQLE